MVSRHLTPGTLTTVGRHAEAVAAIPGYIRAIATVVRGLFLLEERAGMLGITLTDGDRETVHLRRAENMLDAVTARDSRPLSEPRPPGLRVVTTSRGFATVTAAILRARGIRARARCGFAGYLVAGRYEEHWLVEYREPRIGRWQLADVQLDEEQLLALPVLLPAFDLPRGLAWADGPSAWVAIRYGRDPGLYGSRLTATAGEAAVAAAVLRDIACLDDAFCLPWDRWAPMPEPGGPVDVERFTALAMGGEHVHPPAEVYNARRGRTETFLGRPPIH